MANNYVISSVTQFNDYITVSGTVNGIPVSVQAFNKDVGNAMASALAFENFIAPLMLAAVPSVPAAVPVLQGLSFSK